MSELLTTEKLGVMICGHGSRDDDAVEEFARLAEGVKRRLPQHAVEHGYLEFARPIIREGLDRLVAQGVTRILAIPGMLFAAGHAKNDIPSVLNTYAAQRDGLRINYGKELGIDLKLLSAAGARVQEALDRAGGRVSRHETLLMVVGRGTSDPDANSNIAKVMRLLWEGFGFGWGEAAYSGVTFPLVEPALEHAARLGYRRIVVFPYFLFTGVLVRRIYDYTDAVARRRRSIEFVKAPYLNDHPLVIDTFADRIEQLLGGDNAMNCALCKYRAQMLGFETEMGLPQASHHHHVEGIGTGHKADDHDHDSHDHGHDHHTHRHHHADGHGHANRHQKHEHGSDGHHHDGHGDAHHGHDPGRHPYPHADHPLGPISMKRSRS